MALKLNIAATEAEVLDALAKHLIAIGNQAIAARGRYSISLSGGSSPKKLYELLASAYNNALEWNKVDFFFGDERDVPQDDKNSNYLMAKKALFEPLKINASHIFAVETALGPEQAAAAYTSTINNYFEGGQQTFDLTLLGLGDNSHTASLFPHTVVLHDQSVSVQALFIEEVDMYRITMTAPLINLSHHIAFLVYGAGKADAVKHILEDERNIELYPAQLIANNNDTQWFLDNAAAANLTRR